LHDVALKEDKEKEDRNDRQRRAGHLIFKLITYLGAQIGDGDGQRPHLAIGQNHNAPEQVIPGPIEDEDRWYNRR